MSDMLKRIAHFLHMAGRAAVGLPVQAHFHYQVDHYRGGKYLGTSHCDNLVVTVGLNDILDKYLKGVAYSAAHYFGLKSAGNVVAGDTMASHAGWTEVETYDEATRPAVTWGAVAAGSVDNSASKCVYTISGTVTVAGGFLTTVNTKGGATGTLVGGGNFTPSRDCVDNDVLNVTVTATLTAS